MVTTIITPTPEPDNNLQFVIINGQFIFLGNIDDFLEKNYENFIKNG